MAKKYYLPDGPFGRVETKQVAFTGGAGLGAVGTVALFTVSGAVAIRLACVCTESLVEGVGGGTVEVGIAGATAAFIAQATSVDIDSGDVWHDATPDAASELWSVTATTAERILGGAQDIYITVAGQAVTDGTLEFTALWMPLSPAGLVVAA